jgi:hypothetical protein
MLADVSLKLYVVDLVTYIFTFVFSFLHFYRPTEADILREHSILQFSSKGNTGNECSNGTSTHVIHKGKVAPSTAVTSIALTRSPSQRKADEAAGVRDLGSTEYGYTGFAFAAPDCNDKVSSREIVSMRVDNFALPEPSDE